MDETKEYANLARIAYLPRTQRAEEAQKFGYEIADQDDDRVLLTQGDKAIVSLRGTDLKKGKRAFRDLLTDAAVVFGQAEKTPRYIANEQFLQKAFNKGYKNVEAVGHSLGGHGATALAKDYGIKATVFNPAWTIPDLARSYRDRFLMGKKYNNITINTTYTDPVSLSSSLSVTGKVKRQKAKGNPHSLSNFL